MRKLGIFSGVKIDNCWGKMEIKNFIFIANSKIVQTPSMLSGQVQSGKVFLTVYATGGLQDWLKIYNLQSTIYNGKP
jgi:hypothetical protein